MDYAFALGTTGYDRMMKRLFQRRPNTKLINKRTVRWVDQFINHLHTDAGVPRPVGNILIASHGSDQGYMKIQFADIILNGHHQRHTTYEVLVEADNTNVADIPANTRGANTKFHIRGCKIGQAYAVPFVQKFKTALGGVVPVTAPKHFHEVWFRSGLGVLEYLGYDFSVVRPTPFANRNALITAFQSAGLKFIDGSNVPANWGRWIPRNVRPGRRRLRFTVNLNPALTPNHGRALNSLRLTNSHGFRHDRETFTYTINNYGGGAHPPAGNAARKAEMKTNMGVIPEFQAAHPFPYYKRFEINSLNDFVDAFTWAFNYNAHRHVMRCVGTRHKYTVIVPITDDPANANNLFFNFYPFAGNATPVVTQLLENDTRFFLTV